MVLCAIVVAVSGAIVFYMWCKLDSDLLTAINSRLNGDSVEVLKGKVVWITGASR